MISKEHLISYASELHDQANSEIARKFRKAFPVFSKKFEAEWKSSSSAFRSNEGILFKFDGFEYAVYLECNRWYITRTKQCGRARLLDEQALLSFLRFPVFN